MTDLIGEQRREPVSVEVFKGAEKSTPDYLKGFVTENGSNISTALRDNNKEALTNQLKSFAGLLPKDQTFKELASVISRRKNGDLFVTTVEGSFASVNSDKLKELIDDLVQSVPADSEQLMLLHTHPSGQSPIGPIPPAIIGFSDEDNNAFKYFGGKLGIFDLSNVVIGLATANAKEVVIQDGKNEGRAFGWTFGTNEDKAIPGPLENVLKQRQEHREDKVFNSLVYQYVNELLARDENKDEKTGNFSYINKYGISYHATPYRWGDRVVTDDPETLNALRGTDDISDHESSQILVGLTNEPDLNRVNHVTIRVYPKIVHDELNAEKLVRVIDQTGKEQLFYREELEFDIDENFTLSPSFGFASVSDDIFEQIGEHYNSEEIEEFMQRVRSFRTDSVFNISEEYPEKGIRDHELTSLMTNDGSNWYEYIMYALSEFSKKHPGAPAFREFIENSKSKIDG